jgi:hypothetical protein
MLGMKLVWTTGRGQNWLRMRKVVSRQKGLEVRPRDKPGAGGGLGMVREV